jgi:hypothetical protein
LCTNLRDLSRWKLITECRQLGADSDDLTDPVNAAKLSLRSIAIRAHALGYEASALYKRLQALTKTVAPATSALRRPPQSPGPVQPEIIAAKNVIWQQKSSPRSEPITPGSTPDNQ